MAKSQQITKLLKLCEEKWVEAGYFPSTVAEFKSIVKSRHFFIHEGNGA